MLTQEQLAMRRRGIGASEAPILADCDGYGRTLWSLYMSKVEGFSGPSNPAMELGNDLEAGVLTHYRRRLSLPSQGLDLVQPGTLFHKQVPIMFATPDSVVAPVDAPSEWKWNVQVKVVAGHKARLFGDGPSEVPDHMNLQVQWEMDVTGLQRTHLVVLLGGVDFRVYTIDYNEEIVGGLRYLAERFWQDHVEPRVPPAMDGSAAAAEYLKRLHLRPLKSTVAEIDSLSDAERSKVLGSVQRGLRARRAMKRAERELEQARQELQMLLGPERKGFRGREGSVSFLAQMNKVSGKVRWEQLARDLGATPEQIKQYRGDDTFSFVLKGSLAGEEEDQDDDG